MKKKDLTDNYLEKHQKRMHSEKPICAPPNHSHISPELNILPDNIIKYANFNFCIIICSKLNSFQRALPSHIICFWKMELSRPDFRLMTFCEYMKDLNQKKSFQNLKQHFDKNALIRTQAFFWFGLFRQVQFQ